MKIKWLAILFVLYITITLIILFFTKQTIKTDLIPQKEVLETKQTSNYLQTFPEPASISTTSLPAVRRSITIINKSPAAEAENKIIAPIDNTTNQIIPANSVNIPSSSEIETESNPQSGITKTGKYPSKKETQEMNSQGIVLY